MKTALITTTINVPHVLALYRKIAGPDVRFFIAGDEKTPQDAYDFCAGLNNCWLIAPGAQTARRCSELIGWNCVQRRNIALLEAVRWGADVIVTIDDDNIPLGCYFSYFENLLGKCVEYERNYKEEVIARVRPVSFSGLCVSSPRAWFDPGSLLSPPAKHRGFPFALKSEMAFTHVVDAKVGVAAGLCLGDPDIDAVTRIATRPAVYGVTEMARAGVVVDPRKHWTVFNSQNTAFTRELAPAMFMLPGVSRYDDIFASLICQRVMREKNLHVHFGQPFAWQQRNAHNLLNDLKGEILGMERVVELAGWLDSLALSGFSAPCTRAIWHHINDLSWMPQQTIEAGRAFCEDIEGVL